MSQSSLTWQFQRMGGTDQVMLQDAQSLLHLPSLDPKLWAALSCPASGLNFNDRALALLDTDEDGRIRIPEVLEAVSWVSTRLADPAHLMRDDERLFLSDLHEGTPEGQAMRQTAEALLDFLGKPAQDPLTPEDLIPAAQKVADSALNGDGILPPLEDFDDDIRRFIADALAVMGGVKDAGGQLGINTDIAQAFCGALQSWREWRSGIGPQASPAGDDTAEAWALIQQVKSKIDDFYLRCELAAYAPQSAASLNPPVELFAPRDGENTRPIEEDELRALPLARVDEAGALPLGSGLNPAWSAPVRRLAALTAPMRNNSATMDKTQWLELQSRFAPYAEAMARKPQTPQLDGVCPPSMPLEELGEERMDEILASGVAARFEALARQDAHMPAAAGDIAHLERLVLYHAYLGRLLRNFVSFADFYSLEQSAAFQAGTLYIDGRSCRLCLPVADVEAHAELAQRGKMFLLYCRCRRVETVKGEETTRTMHVAAAVTAGSSSLLLTGRNGVFVDHDGKDWDATVVKRVSNPIDLWQAVWEPYRTASRAVSDQVAKFAGNRKDQVDVATAKAAGAAVAPQSAAAAPAKFDIGRNVGIFAAVGIALGALGTAVGTLAGALFSLEWWQIPLVFAGLFIIISGPSVILAWLKLRKRTVGPLLEASGWAVNNQASINLALGTMLTQTAHLPGNAKKNRHDPLHKPARWPWVILLLALAAGAVAGWHLYETREERLRHSAQSEAAAPAAKTTPAPERHEP